MSPNSYPYRGSFLRSLDWFLPADLLTAGSEAKRRTRLLVAGVLVCVVVGIVSGAQHFLQGNPLRGMFAFGCIFPCALSLVALRRFGREIAAHFYLLTITVAIHMSSFLSGSDSVPVLAISVLGLTAAHVLGPFGGAMWTVIAMTMGTWTAWRIEAPELKSLAWTITILSGLIGGSSVAFEVQRRNAVEALDAERDRLRTFGEAVYPMIIEISGDVIEYVSPSAWRVFGYRPEDVVGSELFDYLHPDDVATPREQLRGGPSRPVRFEHRVRGADDTWIWCETHAVPRRTGGGTQTWILGSREVGTERRDREAHRRAERLKGTALLAAGVAHDFNNLLTVISGHAELLDENPDRDSILTAARRAARLTQQLLAFGREPTGILDPVEVRGVVSDLSEMLESLLGEEITLVLEASDEPCWVRADRARIEQIVINPVANSRDAMPTGGRVEISVDRDVSAGRPSAVVLSIRDDGSGMTEDEVSRVFDPFYTTKDRSQGTGLGLASVYGSVTQLGGEVEIESQPGAGTTVRIRLPESAPLETLRDQQLEKAKHVRRSGRILVAEDDTKIRDLLARFLGDAGFEVTLAEDGDAALLLLRSQGEHFDLLVTDMVMPGHRGAEIAEAYRDVRVGGKVLFISGYADEDLGAWPVDGAEARFLAKPFSLDRLLSMVDELIAE